jgi:Aspartyl protease/PDZ domain
MPRIKNRLTLLVLLIGAVPLVSAGVCTRPIRPQRADVKQQSTPKVAQIPFELNGNMIFIAVRANGSKPLSFGLDTGAFASVINTSVAQQLRLKTGSQGVGSGAGGRVTSVNLPGITLDIGGALLTDLELSGMDLVSIENRLGRPMDGILGAEFFRRYVVEIDYEKKEITLFEPSDFVYAGRGESLPLSFYHRHPYVRAKVSLPGIEPIEGEFVIDAGSSFPVILLPSFIERNKLRASLPPTVTTFGRGVGGEIRMPIGRASALQLGGLKLESPVAAFPSDGWFGEQDKAGNIGSAVLRRFKVIFDYSRSRMILEPNKKFSDPFEHDMSGLSLVTESPAFNVVSIDRVLTQSPAAEVGIKKGDEIVSINGRPATEHQLAALREMFRQPGKTFSLQVKRGIELIAVELKTRRLI